MNTEQTVDAKVDAIAADAKARFPSEHHRGLYVEIFNDRIDQWIAASSGAFRIQIRQSASKHCDYFQVLSYSLLRATPCLST